jgi:hypothetical protein
VPQIPFKSELIKYCKYPSRQEAQGHSWRSPAGLGENSWVTEASKEVDHQLESIRISFLTRHVSHQF